MTDWLEWLLDEIRDEDEAEETLRLEVPEEAGNAPRGLVRGQAGAERLDAEKTDAPAADGPGPDGRRSEGAADAAERAGAAWLEAVPVSPGWGGAGTGEAGTKGKRLDAGETGVGKTDADETGVNETGVNETDAARTDDEDEETEAADGGLRLPRRRGTARRLADGETESGRAVGRETEDGTLPEAVRKPQARRTAADVLADSVSGTGDGGAAVYRRLLRLGRAETAARAGAERGGVYRQGVDAPSLTVDELDRAVRRDSRRYDGGMELY